MVDGTFQTFELFFESSKAEVNMVGKGTSVEKGQDFRAGEVGYVRSSPLVAGFLELAVLVLGEPKNDDPVSRIGNHKRIRL
jgi:hypothetical protein